MSEPSKSNERREAADGRPGFDRRMTREEINQLPIRRYDGAIEVVRTPEELGAAITQLRKEKVLGFDTETRPTFKKGEAYMPSLVQLTGRRVTYIFQLRHLKFPRLLRELLSDSRIIKAGVALDQDIRMLKQLRSFKAGGVVDVARAAKRAGIKNHGLRGLAAVLLGFRISKSAQVSNWARKNLTPAQVVYAATDSWVSREIYFCLKAMGVEFEVDGEKNGPCA